MPPYSGLKAIHDQRIEEALEYYHYAGQAAPRQGLHQRLGQMLARFTTRADQKQARSFPDCSGERPMQLLSVSYSKTQECA